MPDLQVDDIQGIVLYGYGQLESACFLLLRFNNPPAVKSWLKTLDVRNALFDPISTHTCTNIAFTPGGLKELGVRDDWQSQFAGEFNEGMTGSEHRQRLLGDSDESHPDLWRWGGPRNPVPHALLMLYGRNSQVLSALANSHLMKLQAAGLELITTLDSSWLQGSREHFGFRDGVSQPAIDGFRGAGSPENTIAAGEFVLGYPNAYGQYTQRPLVAAADDPAGLLPSAPENRGRRDLGINGTYLVFRQLSQDVQGFWGCISAHTRRGDGSADHDSAVWLASKMVGRWPSGAPLVKSPDRDAAALGSDNDFLYHASDPHGLKCPIGSHVRRSHPRDALDPEPGSERSIEVGKRHRILRRGRTYGPPVAESLDAHDILGAVATGSGSTVERGLHFICLNTQIGRQFEFVQHTWVNNPKFDGLYEDDDPLVGSRGSAHGLPGGTFTVQREPVRTRVTGMPRFVQVRGGGYFFLPGLRAISFLASL